MRPLLPKGNDQGSQSKYRKDLHEDVYASSPEWTPSTGLLSAGSVSGSYVRMARFYSVSVVLEAPVTISSGGYFDLPFTASQTTALLVAVGGAAHSAVVNSGQSRVYLPAIGPVSRVVISGVVVN